MNWDGGAGGPIYVLDADAYPPPGGYTVMGTYVAYNGWEATPTGFYDPEGDNFQLISFDFISAWYTSLTYEFEGYDNGVSTGQTLLATVDCFNVTTFSTGWAIPIDEVQITFVTSDYIEGYPGHFGIHYVLDNVLVPEPASLALLGLGALVLVRRR